MTLRDRLAAWFHYRLLGYSSPTQQDLHETLLEGDHALASKYDWAEVKLSHHSLRHLALRQPGYLHLVVHYLCTSQPESCRTYPPTGRWYRDLFRAVYQSPVHVPDRVMVEKVLREAPREAVDRLYDHVRPEHCFSLLDASRALGPEYVSRARQRCLTREEVMWLTPVMFQHPVPSRSETGVRASPPV